MLRYPAAMLTAAAESIQLWLTRIFPALFPFIVSCSILLQLGIAEKMSLLFRPFCRFLFHLDGIAAFPFFMGILSGYPMGARLTAQLYKENLISGEDAQHILHFSNNPGPLFLIGTVGIGFFGMPLYGYALLLCSILGAILTGILLRPHTRKKQKKHHSHLLPPQDIPLTDLLSHAVADGMQTILLIGGYLIFFAAFSEALKQASVFSILAEKFSFLPLSEKTLQGILCGLLEMTNGAYLLSCSSDALRLRLTFTAFLVSFGGLSILGQTFGILSAVPISKKDYLKGKFLNALFSSLFLYVLFPFFEQKAQKAVPVFSVFTETAFTLSFLWLMPSLFLCGVLCHAILRKG